MRPSLAPSLGRRSPKLNQHEHEAEEEGLGLPLTPRAAHLSQWTLFIPLPDRFPSPVANGEFFARVLAYFLN